MNKRIRKVINTSFLIVFLLGYLNVIVPSSVIASLFDLKVYAEDELETEAITSLDLEMPGVPDSINSNETLTGDWFDDSSFLDSDMYELGQPIEWYDDTGAQLIENDSLENSQTLYGHFLFNALGTGENSTYVFDLTQDEVTFNGNPVYSIDIFDSDSAELGGYGYNTGIEVIVAVPVISTGGPTNVNTLTVTGAILNYEAGQTPHYYASSSESGKYTVTNEVIVDGSQNPISTFASGTTYQYRLTLAPTNSSYSITGAQTLVLNGNSYDLVYEGTGKNADVSGNNIVFYGYNIVIPEAQVQNNLEITVQGYNEYDPSSGRFTYNQGALQVRLNGGTNPYTGALTDGKIVVEGTQATIAVEAYGNTGSINPVVKINNVALNGTVSGQWTIFSTTITENVTVSIEFVEAYTLTFKDGNTNWRKLENQPAGTVIDLSQYVPTKTDNRFDGWYDNSGLSGTPLTTVTMNSNKTIYAKWISLKGNVTVTHNQDEGVSNILLNGQSTYGTSVNAYIYNTETNTLKVDVLANYKITSILIKNENDQTVFSGTGPYSIGEDVNIEVPGSHSYSLTITTEQQQTTSYTLTFSTNGGSSINNMTYEENYEVNLAGFIPTKTDYRFDGWYDNAQLSGDPITTITMTTNKIVYAKWTYLIDEITVTYTNVSGIQGILLNGSAVQGNTINGYVYNTETNSLQVLVDDNYRITSLKVNDASSQVFNRTTAYNYGEDPQIPLNGSTAYTITITTEQAPIQYTLTFNTNGGSTIANVNFDENTVVPLNTYVPTRTNYTFDGWYDNADLNGNPITSITMTTNKTVYAKWTNLIGEITITHNYASGVQGLILNGTPVQGSTINGYLYSSESNSLQILVDDNYRITSLVIYNSTGQVFSRSQAYNYGEDPVISLDGDTSYTITAQTEQMPLPTTYTLTFVTNGGNPMDPETVNAGTTLQLANYPAGDRTNYRFDGWYDNADLNGNPITSITMDSNKTIYAKWTQTYGTISVTHNSPTGLDTISLNNQTLNQTNNAEGYLTSDGTNTFVFSPMYLEGYQITSVQATYVGGSSTFGPGVINEPLQIQVPGSPTYTFNITIVKETPVDPFTVTYTLTGLTHNSTVFETTGESDYETTIAIHPDYEVPSGATGLILPISIEVKVGNNPIIDGITYNSETGYIKIPATLITDNITITAHALGTVKKPVTTQTELPYENREIGPNVTNYDGRVMDLTGNALATNVGNYSATYTLNDAYLVWEDKTCDPITINWSIVKGTLNPVITIEGWREDENPNQPVVTGVPEGINYTVKYKVKGASDSTYTTTAPHDQGQYVAKVTVPETANYNAAEATCEFTVAENGNIIYVDLPIVDQKNYIYDGYEITIRDSYNPLLIVRTGASATDLGTHTVRYHLANQDYKWADGTTGDKLIDWTIGLGQTYDVDYTSTYESITLFWEYVPGAVGYQVYECDQYDESCSKKATVKVTTATFNELKINSKHYYKVRAYAKVDGKTIYGTYSVLTTAIPKLNAPTGFKATKNRYQEVKLSWKKVEGAEKYYIQRCDLVSCEIIGNTTSNSYLDKTGEKEVIYNYRVRAYRAKKYGTYTDFVEGMKLNDTISLSVSNISFEYNRLTITYKVGVTKYEIEKSYDNKTWTKLKTIEDVVYDDMVDLGITSFTVNDKKATFGKKVYYRVRGYRVNYTPYRVKNVTTSFLGTPEVTASTERFQEVRLTWNAIKGAEKYYIEKCNSSGSKCNEIANTTSTSYAYKKAKEGTNTYYRVRAYRANKYSPYSEIVRGFRLNDDITMKVKNTNYLTNQITVQPLMDVVKYQIQKSEDNKKWTTLETVYDSGEAFTITDTDVEYLKTYYYRVRAYNGVNWTAFATGNVLVSRLKMPKVTISGTNYEPTLKAGKVTNATGYEFWHSLDGVTWTKEQKSTSKTFKKSYDPYEEHYYRVRAYRTEGSKTYASDFKIVYPYDFE